VTNDELTTLLRNGGALAPTRGRKVGLGGVLSLLGVLLMLVGDDPVLWVFGAVVAVGGVVIAALFAFGWQTERRTWLAREGIVFETAKIRYHVPWTAITTVKLAGASALARVQVTVRDVEEVALTVRRKSRGGRHAAQNGVRRLLNWNYHGSKCHIEFLAVGFGIDAAGLHAILAGYVADAGSRNALKPMPGAEDMSAAAV
jgi:hypothetical protein